MPKQGIGVGLGNNTRYALSMIIVLSLVFAVILTFRREQQPTYGDLKSGAISFELQGYYPSNYEILMATFSGSKIRVQQVKGVRSSTSATVPSEKVESLRQELIVSKWFSLPSEIGEAAIDGNETSVTIKVGKYRKRVRLRSINVPTTPAEESANDRFLNTLSKIESIISEANQNLVTELILKNVVTESNASESEK